MEDQLTKAGHFTSVRFSFAFSRHSECYRDFATVGIVKLACLNSVREQITRSATLKIQTRLSHCEDRNPIQPEQPLVHFLGGQGSDVAGGG